MDPRLHQLCGLCQKFRLKIRDRTGTWEPYGTSGYLWYIPQDEPMSNWKRHHRDLDALSQSAQNGCHLCSLFSFAFKHNRSKSGDPDDPQFSNIKVRFVSSNTYDADDGQITEKPHPTKFGIICVYYKDMRTSFDVLRWPDSHCFIQQNVEPIFWSKSIETAWCNDSLVKVLAKEDDLILASNLITIIEPPKWIPRKDYFVVWPEPHLHCCCGKGVWEPTLLGWGQSSYISADPLSSHLRETVFQWLRHCDSYCQPLLTTKSVSYMPLRLIDVGPSDGTVEPFLSVGSGRTGQYITLSYSWGPPDKTMHFKTLEANETELRRRIPFIEMPQTIQDAIKITRWLDVRYLWVDALCIIQDNGDWYSQSPLMHEIYGNAWLNISADAAEDASMGFLKPRNPQHHQACLHPSFLRTSNDTPLSVGICPTWLKSAVDHDNIPDRSILATRGWVMQERILSQRRLHFGECEISWDCHGFEARERAPAPKYDKNGSPSEWSMALKMRHGGDFDARDDMHGEWVRLMSLYTTMSLTKPNDRLAAIAGLVHEIVARTDGELTYIAGLWKEYLINGLLWTIEPDALTVTNQSKIKDDSKIEGYCAPSWSWASVNVAVKYCDEWGRYSGVDPDEVKLVDLHIVQADLVNPFGAVTSGWMILEGWTAPYAILRALEPFEEPSCQKKNKRNLQLDDENKSELSEEEADDVLCLLINGGSICLALVLTDTKASDYRRIGVYWSPLAFHHSKHLWERLTVTII